MRFVTPLNLLLNQAGVILQLWLLQKRVDGIPEIYPKPKVRKTTKPK